MKTILKILAVMSLLIAAIAMISASDINIKGGNLSIGTTDSSKLLNIKGGTAYGGTPIKVEDNSTIIWSKALIEMQTTHLASGGYFKIFAQKGSGGANNGTGSAIFRWENSSGWYLDIFQYDEGSNRFYFNPTKGTGGSYPNQIMVNGNLGLGTYTPTEKLFVQGNANITGYLHLGSLIGGSPILKRSSEPFVAECTTADDGNLVVDFIHFNEETQKYEKLIERVDPENENWYHQKCYEKDAKFDLLDELREQNAKIDYQVQIPLETCDEDGCRIELQTVTEQREPTISDIDFDSETKDVTLNPKPFVKP